MGLTIEDAREELTSILTEIEITGGSMVTSIYKEEFKMAIETMRKYEYDHNKIEKIAAILKTAKADPTRDEYAEYYLDAIEEVVRWIQI